MSNKNPFAKVPARSGAKSFKQKAGAARGGGMDLGLQRRGARTLGSIDVPEEFRQRFSTGYDDLDLFLSDGGGICPIQAITITAPRGGGKTTMWLQIIQGMSQGSNGQILGLYGSGEEYVEQLALCAERVNAWDAHADNLTLVEDYVEEMETGNWKLIVVDSLPSLKTNMRKYDHPEIGEILVRRKDVSEDIWKKECKPVGKGSIENLACQTLVAACKKHKTSVVFILHLTKDGKVKGDSAIEHTVDTCLRITVPKDSDYEGGLIPYGAKLITCDKNRFGGCGTVAFKMGREGWDFSNPLDLDGMKGPKNEKKEFGGQRAAKKVAETRAVIDHMKLIGKATIPEILNGIQMDTSDASAWDRHERIIKTLVKAGKVIKTGGGKGIRTPAKFEYVA
jgi:DNA repair protein RadA/Sms